MSTLWGEVSKVIDLFPGVLSRPITVRMALNKLKDDSPNPPILNETNKVAKLMRFCKPGTSLAQSVTKGKYFSWIKASFDRPCFTIPKSVTWAGYSIWHPIEERSLSGREMARCGSYPDKYRFQNKHSDWVAIIGNSVPPLFMKAIAIQIYHKLWGGKSLTRYPKTMTYPEILETAWQNYLAPRDPFAPTVISTFAGGGGSSLGYSMAGYRELLAVEWNNNAIETFKLNFPNIPVYHGDIAKLSVKECMELARLSKEGELDLLDGSPPCQGFSTAGKRILNDPRNELFREFIRLLRGLKPKVFVMENVPGLVKGKMKLVFAEIMRELKASGYQVRCKKLNAMYFYVPQSRERLIFIGVRNDLISELIK